MTESQPLPLGGGRLDVRSQDQDSAPLTRSASGKTASSQNRSTVAGANPEHGYRDLTNARAAWRRRRRCTRDLRQSDARSRFVAHAPNGRQPGPSDPTCANLCQTDSYALVRGIRSVATCANLRQAALKAPALAPTGH